jgi:hypothetical protein
MLSHNNFFCLTALTVSRSTLVSKISSSLSQTSKNFNLTGLSSSTRISTSLPSLCSPLTQEPNIPTIFTPYSLLISSLHFSSRLFISHLLFSFFLLFVSYILLFQRGNPGEDIGSRSSIPHPLPCQGISGPAIEKAIPAVENLRRGTPL